MRPMSFTLIKCQIQPLFYSVIFVGFRWNDSFMQKNILPSFESDLFTSTILLTIVLKGTTSKTVNATTATFARRDSNLNTAEGDSKNNNDDNKHHILLSHILATYLTSIPICTSTSQLTSPTISKPNNASVMISSPFSSLSVNTPMDTIKSAFILNVCWTLMYPLPPAIYTLNKSKQVSYLPNYSSSGSVDLPLKTVDQPVAATQPPRHTANCQPVGQKFGLTHQQVSRSVANSVKTSADQTLSSRQLFVIDS